MKIFCLRAFLILVFVLFQLSFFDILFPWFRAPLFLLGVVVAWTLVRGFPSALYMTVPLTVLFDSVTMGAVTWFSVFAVIFAYGTSFLSRRLLLEHQGLGVGLYALSTYGGVLLYQAIVLWFLADALIAPAMWFAMMPTVQSLIISFLCSIPMFAVTYMGVKRFEAYLDRLRQKQFLNVR